MHDENYIRSILLIVAPFAVAVAAVWLLLGDTITDAVFAALKLAVTR